VFLLLSGWAYRHKSLPDGRRQIVALLTAGDVCCIQALFGGALDHTISTLTQCRVALIPGPELLAITNSRPNITLALWRSSMIDTAILREWVIGLGCRSAEERMGHLLLELLVRLEAIGRTEDDSFDLPVTQRELSEVLGLSSVHTNRVLRSLREDGLATLSGGTVVIHDRDRLQARALFSPSYLRNPSGWSGNESQSDNREAVPPRS
jgi:CRP-like cAMP-binding protein